MVPCRKLMDPDTLDFIYSHTRDAPERQLGDARALDTKTIQVFAAASVVVGFAAFAFGRGGVHWLVEILLSAAVIAYLTTIVNAVRQLWAADFRGSLHAGSLWSEFWQRPPADIKHALVDDIAEAYRYNEGCINAKSRALAFVLVATASEAALVGIALIVSLQL